MDQFIKLKDDLKKIGIKKGMVVLVHSSFNSLGYKDGNPLLVIKALQEVVTTDGTILMPTLTFKSVNKLNQFFSYSKTKSDVGIITETFRKQSDVIRSLDPIHSIAVWGKHAEELTNNHGKDYITLGENSPLNLMLIYDAKILMLGCGLKPNTIMHLIENKNNISYRDIIEEVEFTIETKENQVFKKKMGLPSMKNYIQRYDRIENILREPDLIKSKVLNATSYLIDVKKLVIESTNVLSENELYFVDKIETY